LYRDGLLVNFKQLLTNLKSPEANKGAAKNTSCWQHPIKRSSQGMKLNAKEFSNNIRIYLHIEVGLAYLGWQWHLAVMMLMESCIK
jgi:hypothetical protein